MAHADPRVAKWPLMASPAPTLLIAIAYLTTIYYGRRFMAKRKPFSIRGVLIPYNLAMALLNLYIGLEVNLVFITILVVLNYILVSRQLAVTQNRRQYNWLCQPVNYSDDPDEIRVNFDLSKQTTQFAI